ncbi:MAG: hypothetical protein R6U27_17825 [Desulfobacterales bacterium]
MFVHVKKSGKYKYLQIFDTHKDRVTVKHPVVAAFGSVLISQMNVLNGQGLIYV